MRKLIRKGNEANKMSLILLNNGYPVAEAEEKNSDLPYESIISYLSPISNDRFVAMEVAGVE